MPLKTEFKSLVREREFNINPSFFSPFLRYLLPQYSPYYRDNDRLKCIFIHIPKTAGTSFFNAVFGKQKGHKGHIPAVRFKVYDEEKFRNYYKVSIVRNPWDRIHSAFIYLRKRIGKTDQEAGIWAGEYLSDKSFSEFVLALKDRTYRRAVLRYVHFIPQFKWVTLPDDRKRHVCDQLIKFEQLTEGIKKVEGDLDKKIEMPHYYNSNKQHYTDVYDDRMKNIVAAIYHKDIEMFNYQFG
ncbi:MAG TPA: sulfotransferase family 2 domain-containing protein [Balneolaceae bacterium]|nr:sulfotransferase family 2 domain-containing protein [Balneolaceae bacterium]